jgi:phosphomannomutase / phosphoglucomutase
MPILDQSIFRAYDIRGVVGETLTPEVVYDIGLAIGSEAHAQNQAAITVGRDGRLSSDELVKPLIEALAATGLRVIDIGQVPTPVLYFSTYFLNTHSGVMLTGSHNPANYNGLKIMLNKTTLMSESILGLYQRIENRDFHFGNGSIENVSIIEDYVTRVIGDINLKRPLKVVVDAGNGAASNIAPTLFQALGCKVVPLFCEVDGNFPNHDPDPSELKNLEALIQTVLNQEADLGLAFDGDGDRLGLVTNRGTVIWPDRQLMCFSEAILADHPNSKIVFDIKCSRNLEDIIRTKGGIPCLSKTGHSLIKSKMLQENALLAGEMSGHIFFNDKWYGFDDGIYAGARLLEILSKQTETCDNFFRKFPNSINTPELKLPVKESEKFSFIEKLIANAKFLGGKINLLDGMRVEFQNGWGLVRPSNTSPYLILRFEADTEAMLLHIQGLFREALLTLDPLLPLPF